LKTWIVCEEGCPQRKKILVHSRSEKRAGEKRTEGSYWTFVLLTCEEKGAAVGPEWESPTLRGRRESGEGRVLLKKNTAGQEPERDRGKTIWWQGGSKKEIKLGGQHPETNDPRSNLNMRCSTIQLQVFTAREEERKASRKNIAD